MVHVCCYCTINPVVFLFQVDLHPETIETYSGPDGPVDVVLMVHVCYYFRETFSTQIKRALQWLCPGGHLILIHKQISPFRKAIGKILPSLLYHTMKPAIRDQ